MSSKRPLQKIPEIQESKTCKDCGSHFLYFLYLFFVCRNCVGIVPVLQFDVNSMGVVFKVVTMFLSYLYFLDFEAMVVTVTG